MVAQPAASLLSVRLVIARCSVDYAGRLTAHLPLANRLLLVKADGSVLVHSDGGSYKPLNWMSPPCKLSVSQPDEAAAERGVIETWTVQQSKTDDRLIVSLHEVLHDSSHDLAHRQHRLGEIARHATAKLRQRFRETWQSVVLRFVSYLAPPRVITILLASPGVASRGLQVAGWAGTDPDIAPGRRDGQRANAGQCFPVSNHAPIRAQIAHACSPYDTGDPRSSIVDIS